MNKTLAAVIRYVIFAGIAAGLLWYIFKGQDIDHLLESAKQVNYWWILASMMISVPGYVIRAKRWNLLLESLGYQPSLATSSKAVGIGYFSNLAFPRLGEVLRCTVLNRTNKIPLNTLIGTVVAERAIDVICLLILIVVVVVLRIETLGKYLIGMITDKLSPTIIIIAIAVMIAGLVGLRLIITKTKFGAKIKGFVADFTSGLLAVFRLKKISQFLLLTVMLWCIYFGMMYICFFGIPQVKSLDGVDSLFLFVMGSLGMAAPTPGGTGTYHIAVVEGFKLIGLGASEGLVLATVFHLSQVATTCIVGVTSVVTLPKKILSGQAANTPQQDIQP